MGLNNPPDVDLAKSALDHLMRDNEAEILAEEAQHNNEVSEVADADSTKTSGVRPPLSLH